MAEVQLFLLLLLLLLLLVLSHGFRPQLNSSQLNSRFAGILL